MLRADSTNMPSMLPAIKATRTSMTQKSRMTMDTTNHQKKLRRRRQIRGKAKNTRAKKIWQKIWGGRRIRKPKHNRK
jgi:hypothetical protein